MNGSCFSVDFDNSDGMLVPNGKVGPSESNTSSRVVAEGPEVRVQENSAISDQKHLWPAFQERVSVTGIQRQVTFRCPKLSGNLLCMFD